MINFLTECSMCRDNAIFSIIYLLKQIIQVVFIIVPVILIVLVILDIFKNVIAGKEDDMNKNKKLVIKRFIYAVVIFLIPAIVNLFMHVIYTTLDDSSNQSFTSCWEHATLDNVKICNEEALEKEKQIDEEKKKQSDSKISQYEEDVKEQNNSREKGLGKKQEENSSDGNTNSNSGGLTDEQKANANIVWVGDSRTNGMCSVVSISSNETCIAKDGAGLAWLKNGDTSTKLSSALNNKTDVYVIINLGVNSITGLSKDSIVRTVSSYVDYYKALANTYTNAHFIVTSVGVVDEAKEASDGQFHVTNINVNSFNTAIESALKDTNIKYCNINNSIRNGYVTNKDGLHYTDDTYKKIYDASKSCF